MSLLILIHRHRRETPLPEMDGPPIVLVDALGIAPLQLVRHRPQFIQR
jgi:hypothetical protein